MQRRMETKQATRVSPLLWLNLVCLDAPLVAISWQWWFAQSLDAEVAPGARAALFLTAWLIYLADRFGDNLSVNPRGPMSLRQRFCLRHRVAWIIGIAAVALADGVVIFTQLDGATIRAGAVVGLCALIYLMVNQRWPGLWRWLPLKEVSIGLLFAAGTVVGLAVGKLSAAWLLFAGLCALNCICIAVWERTLDSVQGRVSIATDFPLVRKMVLPALLLIAVAGVVVALPIAFSAILLAIVHFFRQRIQADTTTALADLVLLTPLIVAAI